MKFWLVPLHIVVRVEAENETDARQYCREAADHIQEFADGYETMPRPYVGEPELDEEV